MSAGEQELQKNRRDVDYLFSVTYEELRRLASAVRRNEQGTTLTPTALVNEAWLKLAHSPSLGGISRLHFKRIAARAMRELLIEAARRRKTRKRGGLEGAIFVTLDDEASKAVSSSEEILLLNDALDDLARVSPRQAQMVEIRFFGGLEVAEVAELLDISEATVLRDWRAARAWLAHEMTRAAH